jgi:hypothetical protein
MLFEQFEKKIMIIIILKIIKIIYNYMDALLILNL